MGTTSYQKVGVMPIDFIRGDTQERDLHSDRLRRLKKAGTKKRRAVESREIQKLIEEEI